MKLIWYPKCGTCRNAKKWLDEKGISYELRDITLEKPTEKELRSWQKKSGTDVRKMFNTSGRLYREMNLKEKLKTMSEDEMFALLATDGMLVKRPVLTDRNKVVIGFKAENYEKACEEF
ncbi:MAG: arsenate reductase family protein [Solobacterium sp.]|nr:arsenate reductase family protein [Solobacterium sp.]